MVFFIVNIRIVDHALLFKQDKSKMPPFKIFYKQCLIH